MRHAEGRSASELIEEIFSEVSDLPAEQRTAFLDQHLDSSNEAELAIRREVERLLEHHGRLGILDEPLIHSSPEAADPRPALEPGEIINGRFRILSLIGAGGMGEVYEAQDLTAGQTVALKTIRGDMANDASQAERFRRELLISRNIAHRNVCKVFDYDEIDRGSKGTLRFFTMELLRGQTLAQRLASGGRMAPAAAVSILEQVAAGLDEVHRGGIIHRDLKPSNIFLVKENDGTERAVVMDFGLARDLTEADLRQTRTGMVMGTRLYMPPELPKTAGVFSDIYSFGVVALEMVTGEPSPIVAPRSRVPSLDPAWDRALLACFQLDPAKRPASASEVIALIRRRTWRWRRLALAAGIAMACVVSAALAWNRINPAPAQAPVAKQLTFDPGISCSPSSSADGKLIVYSSDRDSAGDLNIWSMNVETGERWQLTNYPGDEEDPALSPDAKTLAWCANNEDTLYIRPVAGGVPRELAKHAHAPRFSPDGKSIAYWSGVKNERAAPAKVWIVPVSGGEPRRFARDFADARSPAWSRDGKSILFRGTKTPPPLMDQARDFWIASIDGRSARATGIGDRLRQSRLVDHLDRIYWDGSRVIFSARNLWSIDTLPFLDVAIAAPRPVTSGSGVQNGPTPISDGRIAYGDWREQLHIFRNDLASGSLTQITKQDSMDTRVSVSADGQTIVFGHRQEDLRHVWIKDQRTGKERELVRNELAVPFVSPDGKTVAMSNQNAIWLVDVATGSRAKVCDDCGDLRGWAPGSPALTYLEKPVGSPPALRIFDLVAKSKRAAPVLTLADLNEAVISPDGKTLAFTIRSGAQSAIYIARLIERTVVGPLRGLPAAGGWADKPTWSDDGKTLYFCSRRDGFLCLWSYRIDTQNLHARGDPRSVRHFHQAAFNLETTPSANSLAVGGGALFFSVDVSQGNIWTISP